ncbi:MAG: chemotaxis protein CheB [Flavisolibacter sp.]
MNSTQQQVSQQHFVVAIGASAGGLEAIHEFFDNMPGNGNFSFIIIQHLSPDYKSLLVELVAKHTNMQVFEAQHNVKVEPNCVYVIPNDKLLTIRNAHLQLGVKNFDRVPNTAIDFFLHSLAEDQGAKAIAVILSGTGTDGSKGIQAIHDGGGVVFVQDPVTAKFDGMPNSAITTGFADYILAPELMPEEIFNHINERPVRLAKEGRPDETHLPEVLKLIEKHCQHDFYNYKTPTILRRIERRMGILGYRKFNDYLQVLRESPDECRFLGKEFLIGVTKFFRDSTAFQLLHDHILPELINTKEDHSILKIWVTACSTGEEAYSLAILIDDLLQDMDKILEVKIFASDVDIDAIEFAGKATYPANSVAEIDRRLVNKYFIREGNMVTVLPRLRKQIIFAKHNILKDPPFIKNDMITCRNMLIYMNAILQRKVLATLQFSLNTGGILFLGPSETPVSIKDAFEEVNGKWKMFKKISNENSYNSDRFPAIQTPKSQPVKYGSLRANTTAKELSDDFKNLLIEEYGFAAIYINKNFEIREAIGNFKKYLSLPDNILNLNILKMVPQQLATALNGAVRKALKTNENVTLSHIRLPGTEETKTCNLFIKPSSTEGYIMIVLGEGYENNSVKPSMDIATAQTFHNDAYVAELEDELKETRLNLQMAVESLETANEELQSSNEELLSANEELQSSNEELQSLNEELHTLNTEHQLRIKELVELNEDLDNYFRSTEIAQVFVDRELRIRKFNPVALKMINLIETDIGRPIEHISTNLKNNKNFIEDIHYVIESGNQVEKEVVLSNGSPNLMRIMPYVRLDKKVDGVIITFIDISNIKELDNIIKAVFNSSVSAIMAFKALRDDKQQVTDFKWLTANYASDELLGKSKTEYIGKTLKEIFPEILKKNFLDRCVRVMKSAQPLHTELQLTEGAKPGWYNVIVSQMAEGIVISLTDISDKKKAEEKLKKNYYELVKAKENYRRLSVELEEKVQERTFELSKTEERFRLVANATNDAIWDWDLVNNRIWWSEGFYTRFGYEKLEHKLTSTFWLEHIHPDDREKVNAGIFEAINSRAKNWSARFRFQKKDGTYAVIWDKGTILLDQDGIPYRMVGAMVDITETEKAEQEIKQKNNELNELIQEFTFVTDFMPQMVWATRPDGTHDFYNKGWYDFTGLSHQKAKDHGWISVVHPQDHERVTNAWQHSLATGKSFEAECRMKGKDNNYRWFLTRAVPLKNEEGVIVKWFGTCTDINDHKLMNDILEQRVKERTEELEKINLELETSNSELLQFASIASHDLKEPLRKIHMFSNLVRDRYLNEINSDAKDYMNRIIKASARMTKLINDLLSFTRLSGSSHYEIVSLNTIVDEVLSDLELSIHEKQAKIEVAPLPEIEVITGQMRQVFQNIISNALKFCRNGITPNIKINAARVSELSFLDSFDAQGTYCRITISDNGIGFNQQYADRIFTIFQRLHTWDKYDGTGIGLAITKKIIERHNGIITAKSKEGEGASFIMVLPLRQEVEAAVNGNEHTIVNKLMS